jgi:signal transduction histidine kinase
MGLGLSVAHAIVTAHGGTITVASKPGKGSTFRIEIPAAGQ